MHVLALIQPLCPGPCAPEVRCSCFSVRRRGSAVAATSVRKPVPCGHAATACIGLPSLDQIACHSCRCWTSTMRTARSAPCGQVVDRACRDRADSCHEAPCERRSGSDARHRSSGHVLMDCCMATMDCRTVSAQQSTASTGHLRLLTANDFDFSYRSWIVR